ncbi:alpha/beta fold hydrolase [Streptomyces sp. NPDC001714]|uniref:alpha/beta fold hydrolase n=1 Tax=Streptomyces sp. NPDC001714 TaxID=3364603 RepID=UPI00368D304C
MSFVKVNGVRLSYERSGGGQPVLLVMGTGASAHVWTMRQTPALHRAGYETITFDNRGMPPSDAPPGKYSLDDMVADTVGLIEALDLAPCRIVGVSLGAMIAQEVAAARPELLGAAVLMATRLRADAFRRALHQADQVLAEKGQRVPAAHSVIASALQMLSPQTLNDDAAVRTWLDLFELTYAPTPPGGGQVWVDFTGDRRQALSTVRVPCRVIAFADDVITPPHLAAEVAETIPDCDYLEIAGCGHLGFLERPDEVNAAIIEFLDKF